MAELGQQTVDFSTLVSRAAEESFLSLKELVEKSKSSDQSDSDKKLSLLKYLVKTQQRMLRLNVLAKWCQQVPLIQYCQQLQSTLSSHEACFTQTADSLFFMHEGLQQARAPIYDVPSAIEVLLTGSYQRLPKCMEDVGMQSTLTEEQQKPALKKLDALVRSKLLEVTLPKEISEVKVADGTALLRVNGEFKVLVTLGYRGHLSMWRILYLELLVGERSGLVKLEELRRHALGDDLERRMAGAENPFMILYSVLHELCISLIMDTVIRQVQVLRQGRWKDAIRFELISDGSTGSTQLNQDGETDSAGLRPGLKIVYWLDLDKSSERAWKKCSNLRAAGDVVLQTHMDEHDVDYKKKETKTDGREYEGQEVLLRIRAYGSSFFTLGINISSSQSVLTSSTLLEYEEALNQGSMTAAEVFISLRSKSILHLFASIGRFLGLEVYEQGFTIVKLPKSLLNGSTMLMQMFEDELNLSLLDWGKLTDFLPAGGSNQTSEHSLLSEFSLEGPMQIAGFPISSFSSIVDEVFELEKGASAPSFPLQNLTSYNASPASRFGSVPINLHAAKAGNPSPKWEGGLQVSQMSNVVKVSSTASHYNGSLYPSNNLKGPIHSNSYGSLSSGLGRGTTVKKLSASKSDQDLASLRSPHSVEVGSSSSVDEDHLRLLNETSMDALSGVDHPDYYLHLSLLALEPHTGCKTQWTEKLPYWASSWFS
ncbi:hypothetical protein GH714_023554 [Hevea brasiliensis]|uniref:Mediator of RNA polymerase II transcription subunit 14 n=1 Tax=Hevea brasiliensis TaxID=3981 RepID=A0A6A6LCY5_HEVBR|nr:hypothetical protein GH714_023554 [Hevea brasiliensis]